ncbi:MAG: GNAT family N-acetyltransferase [Dethiobacteria bacterium]|jgi:ribosomal-protein-alanine N-acetyltransferase
MKNTGNIWQGDRISHHVDWQVHLASPADMPQVADLFLTSFGETITHLYGTNIPRKEALLEAVQDFFTFLHRETPRAFWVTHKRHEKGQKLCGYLVVSTDLILLWKRAIWGGYLLRWAAKFLRGTYGFDFRALGRILINKISFWRASRFQPYRAQILSLAVAEHYRCQGLGRALLLKGIAYLRRQNSFRIKLEVRPWNKPAMHLYQSCGFSQAGVTRDTQGEWLIMIADTRVK